ncbi:MAG TPA: hypothetical protein VFW50_21220 [Streptosporangiaceae bacterium]|nr:hypothetical protein [Streptosporangiaceae bacterium]
MLLGPEMAAIAIVVIGGVLISGWQRLGDQGPQVTFTALFVLLLGGHQPLHYVTHRMIDVGIGVATGLAVNIVVFPPLQLRPAEHAIRQWGESIARALEDLSGAAADLDAHADAGAGVKSWPRHDRQLSEAARGARAATRHARESLRWNPRARTRLRTATSRPRSAGTMPRCCRAWPIPAANSLTCARPGPRRRWRPPATVSASWSGRPRGGRITAMRGAPPGTSSG